MTITFLLQKYSSDSEEEGSEQGVNRGIVFVIL